MDGYMQPCEITTYLGDKHWGLFVDAIDEDKSTYFIPFTKDSLSNLTFQRWRDVENADGTTKILKKYGILIPNESFITGFSSNPVSMPTINASTGPRNGNIKVNKLFIIGAGASHGFSFQNDREYRETRSLTGGYEEVFVELPMQPPLVNDIFKEGFSDIYKKYPGVMSCISDARFYRDVEGYFQKEWELLERSTAPELLRNHINVQFYLQHLFTEITKVCDQHQYNLYDTFVRKLDHYIRSNTNERIAIISFNYDFLLERAIERRNKFEFKTINDYIDDRNRLNLFKPHGSANWGWIINQPNPITMGTPNIVNTPTFRELALWLYYHKKGLDEIYGKMIGGYVSGYGKYNINKDQISIVNQGQVNYPALFLPYTSKDEFIMPYSHQTLMDLYLRDVSEICIIGWKGNEMEFNNRLKNLLNKPIKLTIVDPRADIVRKNLEFIQLDGKLQQYSDFSEYCRVSEFA